MVAANEQADVLFAEYVIAHRSGDADPVPFMDRAADGEREALVTLIQAYLMGAPGRDWDPESFRGSPAEAMVAPLTRALCGVSGTWPVVLPSLRNRAQIKRRVLVERLAAGLGYPGKSQVVEEYYHAMEHGDLPSDGVSGNVLDVLADLLGTGSESLKRAGSIIGGGKPKGGQPVFARQTFPSADQSDLADSFRGDSGTDDESLGSKFKRAMPDKEDLAIDRLFTGGAS